MIREDGRNADQLRPITFETGFTQWAEGSVLVKFGNTHVLCNVTLENKLPNWLRYQDNPHGWLTAEYAMLPRSTQRRTRREQRWPKGAHPRNLAPDRAQFADGAEFASPWRIYTNS